MRVACPHTPRQVRVTCTTANKFAVFYKNSMVLVLCICRVPTAQVGRRRRNLPPERSNPLSGENLIYQVRELRRNFPAVMRCAVGSRSFASRPLAVEPPTGKKEHEGCAPSYSAAGESHLHHGKTSLPSFIKIVWCWCYASAAFQQRRLVHAVRAAQ